MDTSYMHSADQTPLRRQFSEGNPEPPLISSSRKKDTRWCCEPRSVFFVKVLRCAREWNSPRLTPLPLFLAFPDQHPWPNLGETFASYGLWTKWEFICLNLYAFPNRTSLEFANDSEARRDVNLRSDDLKYVGQSPCPVETGLFSEGIQLPLRVWLAAMFVREVHSYKLIWGKIVYIKTFLFFPPFLSEGGALVQNGVSSGWHWIDNLNVHFQKHPCASFSHFHSLAESFSQTGYWRSTEVTGCQNSLAHKVLTEKNTNLYNISKNWMWDRSVGKEKELTWFQYILLYEQSTT